MTSRAYDLDRDRGVATVFGCVCVLALLALTIVGLRLGAAVLARHRAEAAADLGALAGAQQMMNGQDQACAAAGLVVNRNHATLTDCRASGLDVLVTVRLEVGLGGIGGAAEARARAGPVDAETAPG